MNGPLNWKNIPWRKPPRRAQGYEPFTLPEAIERVKEIEERYLELRTQANALSTEGEHLKAHEFHAMSQAAKALWELGRRWVEDKRDYGGQFKWKKENY